MNTHEEKETYNRIIEIMKQSMSPKSADLICNLGEVAVLPLINMFENGDTWTRRWAAFGLGRLGDHRAINSLTQALHDPEWQVRKSAASALGRINSTQSEDALMLLLDDKDYNVRNSVIWALGSIQSQKSIAFLIEALKVKQTQSMAIRALAAIGQPAIQTLLKNLSTLSIRAPILQVFGQIRDAERDAEVVEQVTNMLADVDIKVRRSAAYALIQLADIRALDFLLTALIDSDHEVRIYAAQALGALKDNKSILALIEAIQDENADVRISAVDALTNIGDIQVVPHFLQLLEDRDSTTTDGVEVCVAAALALGRLQSQQAVKYLIQALQDENVDLRWAAAIALGEIKDHSVLLTLTEIQNYDHEEVSWGGVTVAEAARQSITQLTKNPAHNTTANML